MHDVTTLDCSRIAQDLQIRKVHVESVVQLLDEGNTVPFITRYRKERTGGLNEEVIRQIQSRIKSLRQLTERKQTVLKSIEGQGKLTAELRAAILAAETSKRLEDLYLPYKPKKRSLARTARERGLEPLALAIWSRDAALASLDEILPSFVNPDRELPNTDEVRSGVQHILAELIAEAAEVRSAVRSVLWDSGKICSGRHEKLAEGQGLEYKDYFQFSESLRQIPPHRILALNRGEKENSLKIHLEWDVPGAQAAALEATAAFGLKSQLPAGTVEPASAEALAERATPEPMAPVTESNERAPDQAPPLQETVESTSQTAAPSMVESTPGMANATPEPQPAVPAAETATEQPKPEPARQPAPLPALPDPCPLPPEIGEPLSPASSFRTPHAAFLRTVLDDALTRLLLPSLEREIRHELTEEAEGHAVAVFARNLRSLLLQRPIHNRQVLAIDPGFRTGCKIAVLDGTGNLLDETVIYPNFKKAKERLKPGQADRPSEEPAASAAAGAGAPVPGATAAHVIVSAGSGEASGPTPPVAAPVTEAPTNVAIVSAFVVGAAPSAEIPGLQTGVPAAAAGKREEAKAKLEELVQKHNVSVVAIGNGTGCREVEELVAELIATRLPDLSYVIVNEAGASVYSVSSVGREEFPTFDATLRGTISIGRRLQDPLSELVKVDPQNIGVGLYQHDIRRRELKESLDAVVESCVNQVGVDVNTASVPLLRHVSGLNQMVARELVEHRKKHGGFKTRDELLQLPGLGAARFVQSAGFLKIHRGDNPLDSTRIHPESYGLTHKILAELGYGPEIVQDQTRNEEFHAKLKGLRPTDLADRLGAGVPTVADILEGLARPGRDPREDLPPPVFKKGILRIDDLQPGMELKGTVLNVVDFGAFVDIGLKDSGLVHISQMANRYIKNPYEIVAANDVVTVWVLTVDKERHRVSLTMIKPGTPRRMADRPPRREQQQGGHPPRGRRPGPPAGQGQGQRRDQQGGPPAPQGRPPRHGRRPPPVQQPAAGDQSTTSSGGEKAPPPARQAPAPRPSYPPRKHRREGPKTKLSQAALEGKVPLRTFGELSALFAAKSREPVPPAPEPQPVAAVAEPAEAATAEKAPDQSAPPA